MDEITIGQVIQGECRIYRTQARNQPIRSCVYSPGIRMTWLRYHTHLAEFGAINIISGSLGWSRRAMDNTYPQNENHRDRNQTSLKLIFHRAAPKRYDPPGLQDAIKSKNSRTQMSKWMKEWTSERKQNKFKDELIAMEEWEMNEKWPGMNEWSSERLICMENPGMKEERNERISERISTCKNYCKWMNGYTRAKLNVAIRKQNFHRNNKTFRRK